MANNETIKQEITLLEKEKNPNLNKGKRPFKKGKEKIDMDKETLELKEKFKGEFVYECMVFKLINPEKTVDLSFTEEVNDQKLCGLIIGFWKELGKYKSDGFIIEPKVPYLDEFSKALGIGLKVEGKRQEYLTWAGGSEVFYRWELNMINLLFLKEVISRLNESEDNEEDDYLDLKELSTKIRRKLLPIILNAIKSSGLSVKMNIYAGFDSEYELLKTENKNELLSVQLAVNTRLILKYPEVGGKFEPRTLHPITSQVFQQKFEDPGASILLGTIDSSVKNIRRITSTVRDKIFGKFAIL
jgi:hypothetical protein